jgi:hypothetical protein
VIHDSLSGPDAIHPVCFRGATDPAGSPANQVGAGKLWLDESVTPWVVRIRNAANSDWEQITIADHGQLGGLADDDHPQYARVTLVDAKGDLLVGTAADTLARVVVGSNGQVLTADSTATQGVAWADMSPSLTNPMTAAGDIITGIAGGVPDRLAIGATGKVLGVASGALAWIDQTGGMANPMTTAEDIIKAGTSGTPTRLAKGADGTVLSVTAGVVGWTAPPAPTPADEYGALEFTFGDGVSAIVAASEPAQFVELPFDATITRATILADVSGSIVVDVQVTDYVGWPADAGDSICAAAKPTLAGATKSQDATLTGWDTTIVRGRYMRVEVISAATCRRVLLSLAVEA